ncbi:MAG: DUF2817 domain-containing protein [Amaricoccus sp.]
MVYMPLDYPTMRAEFLDAARAAGAEIAEYPHPLPGPHGEALATDAAWIGPRDAARLLVLNSGTHGVEGAYGSAAQVAWLRKGASPFSFPRTWRSC